MTKKTKGADAPGVADKVTPDDDEVYARVRANYSFRYGADYYLVLIGTEFDLPFEEARTFEKLGAVEILNHDDAMKSFAIDDARFAAEDAAKAAAIAADETLSIEGA